MKKVFISALITFFFLGKTSKEVEEKTNRASWFRTFIYFTLTVIFGIFYYRSFQVATISNSIEISALRCCVDSLNNPKDTIQGLIIGNNFKSLGSYKNPMIEEWAKDTNYSKDGGVFIKFQDPVFSTGVVKNRIGLSDSIKAEIESKTGKAISTETGDIYHLIFVSSSLPKFIPIFPIERADTPIVYNGEDISRIEYKGNLKRSGDGKVLISHPSEGYIVEGLSYQQTIVAHDQNTIFANLVMPHPLINIMDIFTACDLSQYTFNLSLTSDMYIKRLIIAYTVPIELGNQSDGLFASANAFGIEDADILNRNANGYPMTFLVKLPTMANLQQIRSLILTGIVTALFSLFCTNLFYRLRKKTVKYLKEKQIDYTDETVLNKVKVKDFKLSLYSLVGFILTFAMLAVCLGLFGFTFLIDEKDFWIISIKIILPIVVILVFIYFHKDIFTFLIKVWKRIIERRKKKKSKGGHHKKKLK